MVLRYKFNVVGHNFMVLRHKFNVVGHESSTQDFAKTTNTPLKRTSAQYCSRSSENECSRSSENDAQDPARTWNKPKAMGIHHSTFARIELYSVLHVRLEFKFCEMLFVLVVCDVALQCHSETLNR